jgi:predicted transcriptional regulator
MPANGEVDLARRERQIMDVVYTKGQASVAEVHQALPDPPSYSAVRALMRILEEKGHLRHREVGKKYVYCPTRSPGEASKSAARRLMDTFFAGSAERAVAALLEVSQEKLSEEELDRLAELIQRARREGR